MFRVVDGRVICGIETAFVLESEARSLWRRDPDCDGGLKFRTNYVASFLPSGSSGVQPHVERQ